MLPFLPPRCKKNGVNGKEQAPKGQFPALKRRNVLEAVD